MRGPALEASAYPIGRKGIDMTEPAPPSPDRPGPTLLPGLLDIRPRLGVDAASVSAAEDAVAQGLAVVKVYAFASVDCPGAAESQVFESDGATAVGGFTFDPLSASPSGTAFTFAGGVYQIFTVPSSTSSVATGINGAGLDRRDLPGPVRRAARLCQQRGTFSNVDFPGARSTGAFGVNDAGQIVGDHFDAANVEHGFVSSGGTFRVIDFPWGHRDRGQRDQRRRRHRRSLGDSTGTHGFLLQAGVFTPITFPLATNSNAFGISDTGEIAGSFEDAAGTLHGFIYAGGAFSIVDVAGARDTFLTRITKEGSVAGFCIDALGGVHGLTGQ